MTDEEFIDQLLKPRADADDAGVRGDNSEVQTLQGALDSYRRETLHWAERRSATQPSLASRTRHERWKAVPQGALALIALATILGGAAHVASLRVASSSEAMAAHSEPGTQAAPATELAEDNRLLSSIDAELSYHGASSVDDLNLRNGQAKSTSLTTRALD